MQLNAVQLSSFQRFILRGDYLTAMQIVGIEWEVENFNQTEEQLLKSTDDSFAEKIKVFSTQNKELLESLEEYQVNGLNHFFQRYLMTHTVRRAILNVIAKKEIQKAIERPIIIDLVPKQNNVSVLPFVRHTVNVSCVE